MTFHLRDLTRIKGLSERTDDDVLGALGFFLKPENSHDHNDVSVLAVLLLFNRSRKCSGSRSGNQTQIRANQTNLILLDVIKEPLWNNNNPPSQFSVINLVYFD